MTLSRRTLVTAAIASICATSAWSQAAYPTKPIKLLIGFAAGGPLDTYTRVLAQDMSSAIGQSVVVVENRAGASGQIATDAVAQAEPDGYTLLSTASTFIVNPILLNKPKPDPLKDFVAVSHTAVLPTVLVVPPDSPVNSLQDLIKLAHTSNVSYSSAGTGGPAHLAGALLAHATGTQVEHSFRVIKRQFGFVKVRYRGLKKNTQQLFTLFALSNLWMVRGKLMDLQA